MKATMLDKMTEAYREIDDLSTGIDHRVKQKRAGFSGMERDVGEAERKFQEVEQQAKVRPAAACWSEACNSKETTAAAA